MFSVFTILLAASATLASVETKAALAPRGPTNAPMLLQDSYQSSDGIPGCKVNTNRIAYWLGEVGCDDICIKVSNKDRSVYLLKISQAPNVDHSDYHYISYDAWNYLKSGKSATVSPQLGSVLTLPYESVNPSNCAHLMQDGKLPLSAFNSVNYLGKCLEEPDSWVAKNYILYNIASTNCHYGKDEKCTLNKSGAATCPSGLAAGVSQYNHLQPVYNIEYPTGKKVMSPNDM
ncbi:hypothetical protein T439DRAFT_380443 [Meredithblackwellia eburnea MCA 4105]